MTVAHEIYLGRKKKKNGRYRTPFTTIWHVDPESDGSDDSCGWSFPKITDEEKDYLKKIAADQFDQLYSRKAAIRDGKDYAHICYNQDIYGTIYWLWRVFNRDKARWQYGEPLSHKELQYVYQLATAPSDNFQGYKNNTIREFEEFVFMIYRSYKRFKRPWYRHPRWHVHHWRLQFPLFRDLYRKYFVRGKNEDRPCVNK